MSDGNGNDKEQERDNDDHKNTRRAEMTNSGRYERWDEDETGNGPMAAVKCIRERVIVIMMTEKT